MDIGTVVQIVPEWCGAHENPDMLYLTDSVVSSTGRVYIRAIDDAPEFKSLELVDTFMLRVVSP